MLLADAGMTAAALLAGVLAWAASAKLQRRQATAEAFGGLGIPRPEHAAWAVPIAELVVAVLLIAFPLVGGALALTVLGAFTWVVVRQVQAGSQVPCACFGQPHAPPVSWTEVVRNGMLTVFALLALFAGPAHVPGPRGVLVSSGLALIALAVLSHLHSTAPATAGEQSARP